MEAKRFVCLVDDPTGALRGGGDGGEILQLPHPRGGAPRRFAVLDDRLLELLRVGQPPSGAFAAWFIDQTVKSDGTALVAALFDPLFLVLPCLERRAGSFQPLAQAITDESHAEVDWGRLLRLRGFCDRVRAVCDEREGMSGGTENVLVRLNQEKLVAVLAAKVRRTARVLQQRSSAAVERARAAGGFFSASSVGAGGGAGAAPASAESGAGGGAGSMPPSLTTPAADEPALHPDHLEAAVGILSDSCSDKLAATVARHLGVPLVGPLAHLAAAIGAAPHASAPASPAVQVAASGGSILPSVVSPASAGGEGASSPTLDAASALRLTRGIGRSGSISPAEAGKAAGGSGGKLKPGAVPQSAAQKKLAATSTKGMKPIGSFFKKA